MFETDSNLDAIFIARSKQEQDFREFLLRWKKSLSVSPLTSVAQDQQPPSPRRKIQGAVVLLFGDSGLGKSTLLRRYHAIATNLDDHMKVANVIDWQLLEDIDRLQFVHSYDQEADPLTYFSSMHRQLAEALAKQSKNLEKQLNMFKAYGKAVAMVREVREQVSRIVLGLRADERYESLIWLTGPNLQAGAAMLKIMRWCFEKYWPERDEEHIQDILGKYVGKGTGIEKKHLSQLREALQDNLSRHLETYLYPEQLLGYALGSDLRTFAKKHPLLLFFDTYERIAGGDRWLHNIMSAAGKYVCWVIAGQGNLWSKEAQNIDNSKMPYGYWDIVSDDSLLTIDFSNTTVGEFSIKDIIDYFAQLHKQNPSLKKINKPNAKRIFDITQGLPLAVSSIASSYLYKPNLNSILESAEHNIAQLYLLDMQNDDEALRGLYGLTLLRRVNNSRVVRSVLNLNVQPSLSYIQILQQLHNRYHFISIEQGQPLLHEKVQNILRRWLLSEGRNTQNFTIVAERLVEAQQARIQELEQHYSYRSLQDNMEDDEWVNTYLDFIEASFWSNTETGFLYLLAFTLAAILYRPSIIDEIKQLSGFFSKAMHPLHHTLWQNLMQNLSAEAHHITTSALREGLKKLHNQLFHALALSHLLPSGGKRMDYEQGLNRLKQYVHSTEQYRDFLTYEARLRELLSSERLYGTTEQNRASRAQIIAHLNSLTNVLINKSFNDLCLTQEGFPGKYARELEGALW